MKIFVFLFSFIYSYFCFCRTVIEDLKLIQKLRQRKNGLSADELALGKQTNPHYASRKIDVCINASHINKTFDFPFLTAK